LQGDYWTAFGDGECYRRFVPLCPSQAFMSVVLAPSRDRQRAVIGLPRLSPLGNDVGVLEAPAGGLSMAYVITAGAPPHLYPRQMGQGLRTRSHGLTLTLTLTQASHRSHAHMRQRQQSTLSTRQLNALTTPARTLAHHLTCRGSE
jgi:hypothetical protein